MGESGCSTDQRNSEAIRLKEMCFQAVRKHLGALGVQAVLDLPTPLIKDLLPHLTVCQLDELQPGLNQRGISTHSGWVGVLQQLSRANPEVNLLTEEEVKGEVMRLLFTLIFYGFRNGFVNRNKANLNTPYFLMAAAKCIKYFVLLANMQKTLQSLTAEQRPILNLLEMGIKRVCVSNSLDMAKRVMHTVLYILHRLLDHGMATELVVNTPCPIMLAWLLHGRGSQYVNPKLKSLMHSKMTSCISPAASASVDRASPGFENRALEDQDDQVSPCKRSKLDSVTVEEESGKENLTMDLHILCQNFTPCGGPSAGACPWGQIDCLEIRQCKSNSLQVLISALPTFFCLRSLTLHSYLTFMDSDVLSLVRALKQLSECSHSSLTDLSISVLPYTELVKIILDASPKLTSLHTEVRSMICQPHFTSHDLSTEELALEKLTVKVTELQTDLHVITSVLRRCPCLTSLHIAGMTLPSGSSQSQLLNTLSESNHRLRSLNLEDMKLADCLPEILNLLRRCKLEELQFNDCRLLEQWSNKEESLQRLVAALKAVPSLNMLSLAQNRLAKNVYVLAELFSGSSPSSVKRLNISSNFIQPADLLEFAKRLRTHRPPHRLTLDLRRNPGDRDLDMWNTALGSLRPFCVLLVEGWKSTDTMVDHISNM